MNDKTISEQEGFLLIQQMIQATKTRISEDGFMYLLWGWLVLIASLTQFVLIQMQSNYNGLAWLLMPVGAVISVVYSRRQSKSQTVRTYVDEFMGYLWGAFGASLFIVLASTAKLGLASTYPMVLVLYGIATFVSGGVLKFRPLMFGGVACWVLSIVSMFLPFEFQLLALAAAVLIAYVIPGYLLRQQYKHAVVQGA